jgi:hypothetical protein
LANYLIKFAIDAQMQSFWELLQVNRQTNS